MRQHKTESTQMHQLVPPLSLDAYQWCTTQSQLDYTLYGEPTDPQSSQTLWLHHEGYNPEVDWQQHKTRMVSSHDGEHWVSACPGILAQHPNIVGEIKIQLWALQTLGLVVNVLITCSIMLAIIKEWQPELLMEFKCSKVSDGNHLFLLSDDNLVLVICLFIFQECHGLGSTKGHSSSCVSPRLLYLLFFLT